jgi:glycosyltransferase involved in cell wall biosynthesis
MSISGRQRIVDSAHADSGKGRVSVCIPSYNSARHIEETIKSVLDSTYAHLEVIVTDNGSTDGTDKIVAGFADERVRFYQNGRNLGPIRNWNRALGGATGEFAAVLFSDDLYGPFWLTWAVRVLERYSHIGWVTTAYRVIDETGEPLCCVSYFSETREYGLDEVFLFAAKLDGFGPGFVARRQILEQIGYYDEQAGLSADNDLFLRLAAKYPMFYSDYPHVSYRKHTYGLCYGWRPVEQVFEGFYQLDKVFSDETLSDELKAHKAFIYNRFCRGVLATVQRLQEKGDLETAQYLERLLHEQRLHVNK